MPTIRNWMPFITTSNIYRKLTILYLWIHWFIFWSYFYALFLLLDADVLCALQPPYAYGEASITNGWHISYIFGLLSVVWRPPGLEVELTLGASERHLKSEWCSPAWSLSSSEFAAALGEMLGVRPPVRICDISEPRRLVIFLKPGPEQKHLQMIRLNANRKSFENRA